MTRIHVICEGQTEEEFVREILQPALSARSIWLIPSIIGRVGHQGGNVNLNRLSFDIRERLLGDHSAYCTTFFDYYGLPDDFPGKAEGESFNDVSDKQAKITQALKSWAQEKLGHHSANRFVPYVQMYEFEGLLFSAPSTLSATLGDAKSETEIQRIRSTFATPECINDDVNTAPSKRIHKLFPTFHKPADAILTAIAIGLGSIRQECPLFDAWIKQLEVLNKGSSYVNNI